MKFSNELCENYIEIRKEVLSSLDGLDESKLDRDEIDWFKDFIQNSINDLQGLKTCKEGTQLIAEMEKFIETEDFDYMRVLFEDDIRDEFIFEFIPKRILRSYDLPTCYDWDCWQDAEAAEYWLEYSK